MKESPSWVRLYHGRVHEIEKSKKKTDTESEYILSLDMVISETILDLSPVRIDRHKQKDCPFSYHFAMYKRIKYIYWKKHQKNMGCAQMQQLTR